MNFSQDKIRKKFVSWEYETHQLPRKCMDVVRSMRLHGSQRGDPLRFYPRQRRRIDLLRRNGQRRTLVPVARPHARPTHVGSPVRDFRSKVPNHPNRFPRLRTFVEAGRRVPFHAPRRSVDRDGFAAHRAGPYRRTVDGRLHRRRHAGDGTRNGCFRASWRAAAFGLSRVRTNRWIRSNRPSATWRSHK